MKAGIGTQMNLAWALLAALLPLAANAGVSKDLESLGGNRAVEERAGRLSSTSQSAVVQGRSVDRNNRIEIAGMYAPLASGNSFLYTQTAGAQLDYHIVPQFSLGVRYEQAFNSLTPEGKQNLDVARRQQSTTGTYDGYADIDYPDRSIMGTASWYMFYGKMNFFDVRVIQFDIYSIGGAGQMTTSRNQSLTWTAGGGIGFWLTNHLTSRFELRYQTYKDKPYTGERDLNLIVANFAFGVLL